MFYFNRICFYKEIDVNKTTGSKECYICHYWYFLDKEFNFQPHVCNGCPEALMMSMNLSDIAILSIHSADYRYNFSRIMQNIDLSVKAEHYKTNIYYHI